MVTRNGNTYRIHTRLGVAMVNKITPIENRTNHVVIRWECHLTLTQDEFSLEEAFQTVPERPFKPLTNYTKLDLEHVIQKLARSPEVERFLTRFETTYAELPNNSFVTSQLVD